MRIEKSSHKQTLHVRSFYTYLLNESEREKCTVNGKERKKEKRRKYKN